MAKIVFPYCRDSGGDDQERSVGDQRHEIQAWIDERGFQVGRWYVDEAKSGTKDTRDQFQQMIVDALRERPDVVITWNFARWARSMDHAQYYRSMLRRAGIDVVSLVEQVPEGPMGRVVEAVIDLSNELYIETLRRDIRRGQMSLLSRGFIPGGNIPVGYRPVYSVTGRKRDGTERVGYKLEVDEEVAPMAAKVFQLRATGASYAEIHDETGLLRTRQGYRYVLENPAYKGIYRWNGHLFSGLVPAIISPELWESAQKGLVLHPRTAASDFLLTKLLRCRFCGSPMCGTAARVDTKAEPKKLYRYYICTSQNSLVADGSCTQRRVRADDLERAVIQLVLSDLLEPDVFSRLLRAAREAAGADAQMDRRNKVMRDITQAERAISDLLDMAGSGIATAAILAKVKQREDELVNLRRQYTELAQQPAILTLSDERVCALVTGLAEKLTNGSIDTKRWVLHQVIDELKYGPITIKFKLPEVQPV